jgi:hypothetical protein
LSTAIFKDFLEGGQKARLRKGPGACRSADRMRSFLGALFVQAGPEFPETSREQGLFVFLYLKISASFCFTFPRDALVSVRS